MVRFKVTICVGFPSAEEDENEGTVEGKKVKKKRVMEAPRAQNHFHFEYQLMADDEEVKWVHDC